MHTEMPVVQQQHRKLEALAGSWVGEETLAPSPWDPKGGPALGRIDARIGMGGFFLTSEYKQERGGRVSYEGHGVYGWDPARERYAMWWFDNIGSIPTGPCLGIWEGNTLTFQDQGPRGHSRYVYVFEGEGRHTFRLESSQDGKQWALFMEGKYRRQ